MLAMILRYCVQGVKMRQKFFKEFKKRNIFKLVKQKDNVCLEILKEIRHCKNEDLKRA